MSRPFLQKVVLVTGAGSGIGQEAAPISTAKAWSRRNRPSVTMAVAWSSQRWMFPMSGRPLAC